MVTNLSWYQNSSPESESCLHLPLPLNLKISRVRPHLLMGSLGHTLGIFFRIMVK